MEYLERYLIQVGRHLHRSDRQKTINELRDLLMENFENYDDPSLDDDEIMLEVIKKYGTPIEVAEKYSTHDPLISKEYTPLFYLIIKIISVTLPGALILANTIDYFTNTEETSIMEFSLSTAYMIPEILQAVIMAFAFVLVTFILLSKYVTPKFEFLENEFNPTLLPPIPDDMMKAPIWASILGIVGSVIFLYLFNLEPGLIAVYYDGERLPLLNDSFNQLLPLINLSVLVSLALYVHYLVEKRKTVTTATIEFTQNIISVVIMIILAQRDIFNPIIINGYDLSIIPQLFKVGMWVGAIGSIIGGFTSYIKVLLRKEN